MPSIARHHAEWLSLVEVSGPFLSMPVLLRVFPQGLDAHDPERVRLLRLAYEEWGDSQDSGRGDLAMHTAWMRWVLEQVLDLGAPGLPDALIEGQAIPPHLRASFLEHGETLQPDYVLVNPPGLPDAGVPRLLVQVYSPTQDLERPVEGSRWKAPPSTRMMELLHATGVRLGLVTNGERWMLVDAPRGETTGFASWYAEMWLEEPLTLRAFCSLLGAHRFFGMAHESTLEAMLTESASSQEEVTNQLGDQVRRAVEVLIQTIDRIDKDRGRALLEGVGEQDLYNAALTVMMRLVFLFCAEERGLLLLGDAIYDGCYAVSTLRGQLREAADQHGEEVLERRRDAWTRLLATFRAVYGGVEHDRMRLRAYGGHLFDPDRYPFLEGRRPSTSWRSTPATPLPIDNRTVLHLLEALQLLQVKVPGGGPAEARRLSFRALDIEQIGHVYEGLLDHTAKRAPAPVLGLEGGRDAVTEAPLAELEERRAKDETALLDLLKERTGRSPNALKNRLASGLAADDLPRLLAACDNDDTLYRRVLPFAGLLRADTFGRPVVITAGGVYVTAGADRRSTGTHYTPKSLTEPMVQHTLDPLVYVGPAEGRAKDDWQLRPARELLDLKICDMAMGSGAFLVQTARYLSERLMEAWEVAEAQHRARGATAPQITPDGTLSTGDRTETLIPHDAQERQALALRLICDRCLYGVDKNPMAVEMAKLSLWLVTLDKERPFTFLDHTLRCGDSLLGIHDVSQLRQWSLKHESRTARATEISWIGERIRKTLEFALERRRKIAARPVTSLEDVEEKERLLAEVEREMALVKLGADTLVASVLAADPRERAYLHNNSLPNYINGLTTLEALRTEGYREGHRAQTDAEIEADVQGMRENLKRILGDRTPFHWPLEFPEVFVGAVREGWEPGFSAIIGNPPFMGGKKITGPLGSAYRAYLVEYLAYGRRGNADLSAYFFLRAGQLARQFGDVALLATNTIAQGDTREVGLEQLVERGFTIPRAVVSRPWPGGASLAVSQVWMRRGKWLGQYILDDVPVSGITAFLAERDEVSQKPVTLAANAGKSYQGTIVLGKGFLLSQERAEQLIASDGRYMEALSPYLSGEDLNSRPDQSPSRWVINFHDWPLDRARDYGELFQFVRDEVKPVRDASNKAVYRDKWWLFAERQTALYSKIERLERVLVVPETTKYCAFSLCSTGIIFSHMTKVLTMGDFSEFALLSSSVHESWARQFSSTLETRLKYATTDCFENFPFPDDFSDLDDIGQRYHTHRQGIMLERQEGLTKTYNRFHDPHEAAQDIAELRELHLEMDQAVARAYGWDDLNLGHDFHQTKQGLRYAISEAARREVLGRLLRLNHERHAEEVAAGLVDENGKPLKRNGKNGNNGKRGGPLVPAPTRRETSQSGGVAESRAAYTPRLFGDE